MSHTIMYSTNVNIATFQLVQSKLETAKKPGKFKMSIPASNVTGLCSCRTTATPPGWECSIFKNKQNTVVEAILYSNFYVKSHVTMTRQQHTTRSQMPRWSFVGFWGAFREALEGKQLIPGSFNAQWALKKRRKNCQIIITKIWLKRRKWPKKNFLNVILCTSEINLKKSKRPENTIIILVYLLSKIFPFFNLIFAENYTLNFLKLLLMKLYPLCPMKRTKRSDALQCTTQLTHVVALLFGGVPAAEELMSDTYKKSKDDDCKILHY